MGEATLYRSSKCFLMALSNHSFLKSQIRFFKEDRLELVGNLKAINHILGKNLRIWVYFIGIFKVRKTAFMLCMLMIVGNSILFFCFFFFLFRDSLILGERKMLHLVHIMHILYQKCFNYPLNTCIILLEYNLVFFADS